MPNDIPFQLTAAPGALACIERIAAAWVDPVELLAGFADEPYAGLLLSGEAGWSYLLRDPDVVAQDGALEDLLSTGGVADDPPFQGGVVGLASYEFSAQLETSSPQPRDADWPDLTLIRYPALVAFQPRSRRVLAIGRGASQADAQALARRALGWLAPVDAPPPAQGALAREIVCGTSRHDHAAAVAEAVARIAGGEIFQANLARPWRGRIAGRPFDLFRRLARRSPAPYAAYLRLPGRALVSNSPERFLSVRDGEVCSHPIKGTRPRACDPARDAANAADLLASAKDQAENLMIVDLMRNDLSRVCAPGTVEVPELAGLRSYANVHHLVSRVRGRLQRGRTAWDAFLAAFPPGSVTGAPKLQAMQVIADYEPPRGPYCGSLFWAGPGGALEASVLIRTAAFVEDPDGWRFEARAGGGIVADSDPVAEVDETEAKISAILAALAGE